MRGDKIKVEVKKEGDFQVASERHVSPEVPRFFDGKEIIIRDAYGLCFKKEHLGVIQQKLREQLLSSYLGGGTTDQAAAGIRSALRDYVTLNMEQASTIARTVLLGALIYGRFLAIKKSGFKRKEWFTANNQKVKALKGPR